MIPHPASHSPWDDPQQVAACGSPGECNVAYNGRTCSLIHMFCEVTTAAGWGARPTAGKPLVPNLRLEARRSERSLPARHSVAIGWLGKPPIATCSTTRHDLQRPGAQHPAPTGPPALIRLEA